MRHAKKIDPILKGCSYGVDFALTILLNMKGCTSVPSRREAAQMGHDAVKRLLVPEKVRHYKDPYGVAYRDRYTCPVCGRRLRNNQPDPHCPACGQLLDWDI